MDKRFATYYIENGKIEMDFFGVLGYETRKEAELYLKWVINFWN